MTPPKEQAKELREAQWLTSTKLQDLANESKTCFDGGNHIFWQNLADKLNAFFAKGWPGRDKWVEEVGKALAAPPPASRQMAGSEALGNGNEHFGLHAETPFCKQRGCQEYTGHLHVAPASLSKRPTEETGWLIERRNPGAAEYLNSLDVPATWTQDSLEAIRFCRRRDADKVAEIFENEDILITEHTL